MKNKIYVVRRRALSYYSKEKRKKATYKGAVYLPENLIGRHVEVKVLKETTKNKTHYARLLKLKKKNGKK